MQSRRLAVIAAIGLLFLAIGVHAQVSSVKTTLLGRIDSRQISEGAPIFVKAISAWKQGGCSIPLDITFEGRIAKVVRRSPSAKREEVALRFDSIPCSGDGLLQIIPILVAIRGPQKNSKDDLGAQTELLSVFAAAVGGHAPVGVGGAPSAGSPRQSIDATLTQGGYIPAASNQEPLRVGEVRDFPKVKLSLPAHTSDPTTLSSSGEFLLGPDTQFVLAVRVAPNSAPMGTAPAASAPAASAPEPPAPATSPKLRKKDRPYLPGYPCRH